MSRIYSPILGLLRRAAVGPCVEDLSDAELLRRFAQGRDEGCFRALLRRHGAMVLGACRAVLRHEQDAEDAFQAVFLVLARNAGSLRSAGSVCAWLHGVAVRTALRARTGLARRRKHEGRAAPPEAAEPEEPAWAGEEVALHEELDRLGEGYRAPLVLCYLEGRSQDEAARILGLPKGTLKGRLERGRTLLRERLTRRGLGAALPAAPALAPLGATAVLDGGASRYFISLAEGVVRDMFIVKLKAAAGVACLAACACVAFAAFAVAQVGPAGPEPPKEGRGADVRRTALTPEALAAHLGVVHASFELPAARSGAEVKFSVDVYEGGKKVSTGDAVESSAVGGKHTCSVLFSRKETGKLHYTVVTSSVTYNGLIDDPLGGPGQYYPGPRMDVHGRIPLALQRAKGAAAGGRPTVETAGKALVLQVKAK